MDRIRREYAQDIARAYGNLPQQIANMLQHVHFLTGTDPIFTGLHRFEKASYGRSYRDTAHCVLPCHQTLLPLTQRQTTIVLPSPRPPNVIVHELGHALHEIVGYDITAEPTSRYARTNSLESFAEAFTSWIYSSPDRGTWYGDRQPDPAFVALMESL